MALEDLPPVPITLGGVIDPAHAVGRDADAAEILSALGTGESVSVPGERRHGKTVLSHVVEERARALGWIVVARSLEGSRSIDEVAEALAHDLVAVLPRLERVKAWLGSRTSLSAEGVQIDAVPLTLEEVLADACSHTDRLLLILDELPICARALERSEPGSGLALMHRLRRLRQSHKQLTMLCLGSIGFHHVVPDLEGAVNDMYRHALGPLAPDGALELAMRLLNGTDLPRSCGARSRRAWPRRAKASRTTCITSRTSAAGGTPPAPRSIQRRSTRWSARRSRIRMTGGTSSTTSTRLAGVLRPRRSGDGRDPRRHRPGAVHCGRAATRAGDRERRRRGRGRRRAPRSSRAGPLRRPGR